MYAALTDDAGVVLTSIDGTSINVSYNFTVTGFNNIPGAPTIDLTPNSPTSAQTLYCNVTTNSTDADSDSVNYTYEWYNNSVLFKATRNTGQLYDTVGYGNTTSGETWNCTVIPFDGTINGTSASDKVTIGNATPVVNSVNASSPIGFGENVTITANITDADGQTDIDTVLAGITPQGESQTNYSMSNISSEVWQLNNFTDFTNGTYSYTVYVNDTNGLINSSSGSFEMYANLTIQVRTLKNNYYDVNETVNLTDPPELDKIVSSTVKRLFENLEIVGSNLEVRKNE